MVIVGKYELVDSNRFDEFLKSIGAGMREREQVWKFKPFIEWASTPDGKWMQRTIFGVKNCDIYFVPGEEFEEEYFGTKLKSKILFEENRIIHKQRVGPVEATVTREFNDEGEMISIFQVGDTVATRRFRKIKN